MPNSDEIEILELDSPKKENIDSQEVKTKSKVIPLFLLCTSILIITQIIVYTIIVMNSI